MKLMFSILIGLSLLITPTLWGQVEKQLPLLHTSAQAELTGDNDSANIQFSIISEDKRLETCHKQNALKAKIVAAAIKKLNINGLKIKTANYHVYPKRNYKKKSQEIIGYKIQNTMAITIENLDKKILSLTASKVIDTALSQGANQLGSITFYIKDKQPLINQALTEATGHALRKAKTLAQSAGVSLGPLHRLSSDSNQQLMGGSMPQRQQSSYMKAASAPTTPIEAGESKITATVSLSYIIK